MRVAVALTFATFFLSGCVDLGEVGLHPELKTGYFTGGEHHLFECMNDEFMRRDLVLERDTSPEKGDKRFNLLSHDRIVSWVEISHFSYRQSRADFYYNKDDKNIESTLNQVITSCQRYLG